MSVPGRAQQVDFHLAVRQESQRGIEGQETDPRVDDHKEENAGDYREQHSRASGADGAFDEAQQRLDHDFTEILEPSRDQAGLARAQHEQEHQEDAGGPAGEQGVGDDEIVAEEGALFVCRFFFAVFRLVQFFFAVLVLRVFGVEEIEVMVPGAARGDDLWRKVHCRLVYERPLSGLTRCLGLFGLYQSCSDGSCDEPGNEQSGEYQQSAYQQALAHWEVSPSDPDLPDVELLLNRGSTIL